MGLKIHVKCPLSSGFRHIEGADATLLRSVRSLLCSAFTATKAINPIRVSPMRFWYRRAACAVYYVHDPYLLLLHSSSGSSSSSSLCGLVYGSLFFSFVSDGIFSGRRTVTWEALFGRNPTTQRNATRHKGMEITSEPRLLPCATFAKELERGADSESPIWNSSFDLTSEAQVLRGTHRGR